jgi:hypothetical protein
MKTIKQIFCTKIGWMLISFILMNLFIWLEFPVWLIYIPASYMVGLTLVAIIYAWIINPLRDRRK